MFYVLIAGFVHRTMLTYKGYESWREIPNNHEDAPLVVFGSMFWPVTALLYSGILISKKMTENED